MSSSSDEEEDFDVSEESASEAESLCERELDVSEFSDEEIDDVREARHDRKKNVKIMMTDGEEEKGQGGQKSKASVNGGVEGEWMKHGRKMPENSRNGGEEEGTKHGRKMRKTSALNDGEEGEGKRRKQAERQGMGVHLSKSVAGIVYLSRVPPFMKPHKVKYLLSRYGSVGRVYLKPEDHIVRQRRVKFKGNKKKNFTEGWVEFHDKRVAKTVALMLNNTPIGGKKRSYYHDDLWNIKYLSKFRWTHLTEKIAYEQAVREQKMRTEISQAKRENSHYLASVEKGKEIDAIVERKRKRGATEKEVTKLQRSYKQRKVSEGTGHARGADSAKITQMHNMHIVGSSAKGCLSDSLLKKILPG